MEAQGDPFRRGLPTLQTSLTLPELPRKTRHFMSEDSVRFLRWRGLAGKFFAGWGGMDFFAACGYRTRWVGLLLTLKIKRTMFAL